MANPIYIDSQKACFASLPLDMQSLIFHGLFDSPKALKAVSDSNKHLGQNVLTSLKRNLSSTTTISDEELRKYFNIFQKIFPEKDGYSDFPKYLNQVRKIDFSVSDDFEEGQIKKILTLLPKEITSISFPYSRQIQDVHILEQFPKLNKLSIAVKADSIPYIVQRYSESLLSLSLFNSDITDQTIGLLNPLRNRLVKLDLSGKNTKLTQEGLNELCSFTALRTFNLAQTKIPSMDISSILEKLPQLSSLDVSFNTLEKKSFLKADMSRLKKLHLKYVKLDQAGRIRNLSSQDIALLETKFPKLDISIEAKPTIPFATQK